MTDKMLVVVPCPHRLKGGLKCPGHLIEVKRA